MHSTFSDGEFTPTELVGIARKNGVSILSLTDHDTFEGIEEFVQAAQGTEISAFPGIEITTQYQDFNVHLLAYFKSLDSINTELAETVAAMAEKRVLRMRELIDRINGVVPEKFKGKILFENVRKAAEGVLARPHLAREMVRLGIVPTTGQAFEHYLVQYNGERTNLDVQTAIALIRKCGGVPVIAHPGERTYSLYHPDKGRDYEDIPAQLDELKSFGLLGLECLYPYHEKINKVEFYTNLANKMGLIVTGSRDFHGFTTYQKPSLRGATTLNDEFFDRFQEAWG